MSTYSKQWHRDNRDRHKKTSAPAHKRWKARKKAEAQALVNDIKRNPCTDCKVGFHPWQMQFDHRDPTTKSFDIAHAVHWAYRAQFSKEAILEEIRKCDLVCANCHADRTYRRNHPMELA